MILGIPVVDGHDTTKAMLRALVASVTDPENLLVVIIDNGSKQPYRRQDYAKAPFKVEVYSYSKNRGYYYPLKLLYNKWSSRQYKTPNGSSLIGLIHNDLLIYQPGWDQQLQASFDLQPKLGLVGLCGSNEIDSLGGRGGGTMCNFIGAEVKVGAINFKGQDSSAGRRINKLEPAVVLDSLFMCFRAEAIPHLEKTDEDWNNLPLAHFYDRIWPCRVLEAGYNVAVAPYDCDHIGGLTTTGNMRYREDCIKWLDEHAIPWRIDEANEAGVITAETQDPRNKPSGNPETEMYLVAERRFLGEYDQQKHFIPLRINENWEVTHTYGRA